MRYPRALLCAFGAVRFALRAGIAVLRAGIAVPRTGIAVPRDGIAVPRDGIAVPRAGSVVPRPSDVRQPKAKAKPFGESEGQSMEMKSYFE